MGNLERMDQVKRRVERRELIALIPEPTLLDRAVGYFNPVAGLRRMQAKAAMAIAGGYIGASKSRRATQEWRPSTGDADADLLLDLATLRERSRDLVRNDPIAAGAISTKVANVVGSGLRFQPRIDRDALKLTDTQAEEWERKAAREWRLFWESPNCDAARTSNGYALTALVYRSAKDNGDVFVLLPRLKAIPGHFPYTLRLQVLEADRICNKDNQVDTTQIAGGVEHDQYGAPLAYYVADYHPGSVASGRTYSQWTRVPAFGEKTGLRNMLHLYRLLRPGQTRGVPDLAPVIEPLKQLSRYKDAELAAAVIAAMFTVFVKTEAGDGELDVVSGLGDETGATAGDKDYKLASGAIIGLAPGEDVSTANPGRPNSGFDPFVLSILRQIGVALELPYEVLIKHYTSSYSAARASMLEAWRHFTAERQWLIDGFLKPVYEIWLWEAVALGRISAPGYFADPLIRKAYTEGTWVGPARGMINEKDEVEAAKQRMEGCLTTLAEETAQMTGGDYEQNLAQIGKENTLRKAAGLSALKGGGADKPAAAGMATGTTPGQKEEGAEEPSDTTPGAPATPEEEE